MFDPETPFTGSRIAIKLPKPDDAAGDAVV
jgi:hypothetical protein